MGRGCHLDLILSGGIDHERGLVRRIPLLPWWQQSVPGKSQSPFPPPPPPAPPDNAPLPSSPAKRKVATPAGPNIAGNWSGELNQVGNTTSYKFELSITPKGAETKYPDLDCVGKLILIGQSKSTSFLSKLSPRARRIREVVVPTPPSLSRGKVTISHWVGLAVSGATASWLPESWPKSKPVAEKLRHRVKRSIVAAKNRADIQALCLSAARDRYLSTRWRRVVAQNGPDWVCAVTKAALSSGCESHPATAPAGSNRSSHGGNEVAEAFG